MTQRKSVILSIRVSPLDAIRLQSSAANANVTLSKFVRSCLKGRPAAAQISPVVIHDLAQVCMASDRMELHELAERVRGALGNL